MPDNFCVAVFGGAVAGSEAVEQMIKNGISVVVFDQNTLPYGKIESGLPKWHVKLRNRQEERIDARLDQPGVYFVPNCTLGVDIDFDDIVYNWDFNALLLATGAWKDRALPVEGIEDYLGKGFYYQNPFVQWFNQSHDPNYSGPDFHVEDNALVIGGGLASIDVAKILMIETCRKSIKKHGKELDTITIEKLGLEAAAKTAGLSVDDLGIQGCKIYYRRRIEDMPLSTIPESSTDEEIRKAHEVRKKIVKLAEDKFLFKVIDCHSPVKIIVKDDRIAGMVMRRNKIENGRAVPLSGTEQEVNTSLIISSIGSIPDKISGIKQVGEKFDIEDPKSGKLRGYDHVFVLGNAVTGKGNIKDSQLHGRAVSESIIKNYLGLDENSDQDEIKFKSQTEDQLIPITNIVKQEPLSEIKYRGIIKRVEEMQKNIGYINYRAWINKNMPVRLENMV